MIVSIGGEEKIIIIIRAQRKPLVWVRTQQPIQDIQYVRNECRWLVCHTQANRVEKMWVERTYQHNEANNATVDSLRRRVLLQN